MAEGNLELTIVEAEGLKNVKIFGKGKMSPYAVAWIDPQFKKVTKTLQNSGTCPVWNDTLSLHVQTQLLNNPNAALIIQVLCAGPLKTKTIGTTTLMLNEIKRVCSMADRNKDQTFTLQLWRRSGRAYGVLKVSLKLKGSALFEVHDVPRSWAFNNPQTRNWTVATPEQPNWTVTGPQQPNWALNNAQTPNWPATNTLQHSDVPVQGIPIASMYPPLAPLAVPSDTTGCSTLNELFVYSHTPESSTPLYPPAAPSDTVDYSLSNGQCGYSDTPQPSPPAYMPPPPTSTPVKQNNASRNFFVGLLSGAVAAILVGSAAM